MGSENRKLREEFQGLARAIAEMLDQPRDNARRRRWVRWPQWRRPGRERRVEVHDGAQVGSGELRTEPTRRPDSPSDPELREALARVLAGVEQAKRLSILDDPRDEDRRGMLDRLADDLTVLDLENLGRDAANEVADALDRVLIDIGDDVYLFEELQRERFFHDRDTAAEIWTTLYREEQPELVRLMREGSTPEEKDILQARHWLLGLRWTGQREIVSDQHVSS